MTPQLIFVNDTLIIPSSSKGVRMFYFIRITLFIVIVLISLYYFLKLGWLITLIAIVISFPIYGKLSTYFFTPVTLRKIVISKHEHFLKLNSKQLPWENLLFLSVRESENYLIIRLEATRKNIVLANEQILYTGCENLEEALAICRQIKDFIDPNLKINKITIGTSDRGSKNKNLEIWTYVD